MKQRLASIQDIFDSEEKLKKKAIEDTKIAEEEQKKKEMLQKVKDVSETLSAKVEMNHYSRKATMFV